MELTQERLKKLLHYDPETGIWTWLQWRSQMPPGSRAGTRRTDGRWIINVQGRRYLCSRLAFFYMTGEWPAVLVDHINRDGGDDRWCNLRSATFSQNSSNKKMRSNNTTGYIGVQWSEERQKWVVYVNQQYVGRYTNLDEAVKARDYHTAIKHGAFAVLNQEE